MHQPFTEIFGKLKHRIYITCARMFVIQKSIVQSIGYLGCKSVMPKCVECDLG
jgi:hypothetical protein